MLGFFKKSEPRVIGIDVGSSSVKIVGLSKKGDKAVLDTYGALALGPYAGIEIGRATQLPPEKIALAIKDLIREAKVFSKIGGMAIPISSTLMSLISLPSVDEKELATMVPLEARKYIPVPISEVTLDWSVVPRNEFEVGASQESGDLGDEQKVDKKLPESDVLIVAIHNDALSRYQAIIKKAGLDVSFFEVELFSTMRSVTNEESGVIMVIDIGAAVTKFFIIERGVLRISHSVTRGSQDITFAISKSLNIPIDKAEILKRNQGLMKTSGGPDISGVTVLTLEYIFAEAGQSLSNYQRKNGKSVNKIFLVGGGASLKGIVDFARARLETDVLLGDPFSKVETPAFLENVLKTSGPEFAVAVGVALRRLQEL